MGVLLYNKLHQMIEIFNLLQLIHVQVLTPGSNLISFYENQNEVGMRTSISHISGIIRYFQLKMEENTLNNCIV